MIAGALAAALVLFASGSSAGGIDFRSTFDGGTISPWQSVQTEYGRPLGDTFRIVDASSRSGGRAAMFVARHGYSFKGYNEGVELCCGPRPPEREGSDYWYAWSTMFGTPWYGPYRWGIFAQWHSEYGLPPPLDFNVGVGVVSVQLHTGAVRVDNGGAWAFERTYRILNEVTPGRWHDFVLHVHWSAYARGSVTVWHRLAGEPRFREVLNVSRVPTLQRLGSDVSPVYTLLGIYRGSYCDQPTRLGCRSDRGVQPDTVVYQDEFRRSSVMFPWCLACRR